MEKDHIPMSHFGVRTSKQSFAGFALLALAALILALSAGPAGAQQDNFLNGDGHDNAGNFNTAGTYVPNAVAPVSGAVTAGAQSLTIGAITAGSAPGGSGAQPVTFANDRLVMIYQGNGVASAPTSGNQSAYALSNTTAGHWEFARISTVSGSTLNFTAKLLYDYNAGTTQVIAVPEWSSATVSVAGVTIQAPAWNGSVGGVLVALVQNTVAFNSAATVTAAGQGFRGGLGWLDNGSDSHACGLTQYDSASAGGTYGSKGEGFYATAYSATTPNASTPGAKQARGNQINAGGGGNCFNASGGGGSNVGAGGQGGNTLNYGANADQPWGGMGGAALTYNAYQQLPMGGGGGSGERNNNDSGNGGRGGGVIYVRGNAMTGSGTFTANGSNGTAGNAVNNPVPDGAGGAGAGGTIVLRFVGAAACTNVTASGGTGGNNGTGSGLSWTPGGGGGGGAVYLQKTSGTCSTSAAFGSRGTGGVNNGATNGGAGATSLNTNALAKPTVTLAAPVNGNSYSSTTPAINGTATNNSTVYVFMDDVFVGTATASGLGAWTYSTAVLSQGGHNIKVFSDVAGSQSDTVTASFTVDTSAPAAPTITTPATSPFYSSTATPTVGGTAENNATVKVYDGVTLVATTTANGSGNWSVATSALSTGSHTITATATDAANNVSVASGSKTIIVDTTAPTVSLTAPANGSSTNDNTPAIAFSVTDTNPGASSFCIVDSGVPFVCTSGSSLSTLADGSHTLRVTNTDLAGNVGTSATNTFTVDTAAPSAPAITTPATSPYSTNDTTPTVAGTAEANSTVRVYDGVTLVGTTTADGSGNWTLDTSALSVGSHTITATATDAASNTSVASGSKTIIIDTTAPAAPVITTPATSPYATSDTTPTVAGTAEPNSTVTVYDGVTPVGTTTADGSGNWTLDTSALSEASHNITATATDAAGNISPGATAKTIIVDATAPAAPVITTPATSPYYTQLSTPTVAGTAEPNSTVKVYDGVSLVGTTGADGSGNWGLSTSSLSQGSHTITATATDAAGNVSTASGSKTIIVDSVAPSAPVITTPATSPSYASTTTPTVAGTAEANSTVKVYDGLTLVGTTTADGSGNWTLSTSALSQGPHPISATATDAADNVSAPATSKIIVVDTIAPVVTITAPADGSTLATTQPSISFNVVDDNTSTSECNIDGSGWVACSSGYTPAALDEGPHSVVVRHTDLAGNVGTSAPVNFTVDTVAPDAPTITSGPSGPVATVAASFDFTGEPAGSYECYVDSPVDWQPCTSPAAYGPMDDGPHTFHVRQIDDAGNVGDEASQSWTVDTIGPPAPSVNGPSGTVGTSDASIDFSDTEAPVTFVCGLDGATPTACTSPVDLTGLADGPHSYSVYALDPLGNVSPGTTITWTVDSSLFTVSITSGPTGTVATSDNSFDFVATITSGTTYECRVDSDPFASCTSPTTSGSLPDGSHTFEVRAKHGSQTSPVDSRTYTIDTAAPSIDISAPTDGQTVAPAGDVAFTATDDTGPVTTECAIDSDTPVSCTSPFAFSGLSTGPHSVTVTATDGVGNATSLVRNFIVDATPPNTTITSTPDSITNQTGASFQFTSSEGSSTFECKIDSDSFVTCASPWNYTGLTEGSHTFEVRAIDQYGNTDPTPDSYTWTIDLTAPSAPAITTPATDIVTADNTPSVGGTAEPDSTVNVYEGLTLIGTATADGSGDWSLSPDPTLSQGDHTLTAYATDAAGNVSTGSSPRVITIDTIAPSVAIGSPPPDSLVGTDTPDVAFVATDDHLTTVECSVDGGSWTPCSSPWTTPSLSDGPHTASVRATDAAGNSATDTTNFTVDNTAPADPTVDTPATDVTTSDVRPTFAGDAEADSTVRLYVNGTLTTTTTADGSGRWSFTPSSDLPDGVYAVYVTSEDAAGNLSGDSNTRTVTVDTTAPADPTIDIPAADTVTSDATPTISGTAEPSSTVKVYVDATQVGTTTADGSGSWSWTPSSDLSDGDYAYHVTATDAAGNTSNDSNIRTITVDTQAPAAPSITTPATNIVSSSTTQAIGGTAEANSSVSVYEGAALIGTATADGSGNWSLSPDPTFAEGVHTLTAYATDDANNISQASGPRVITIDTTAPDAPAITAPVDGAVVGDATPTVFGTSEADATVEVYEGGTLLCTTTADAVGNWSCTSSALTEGDHTLHATATDAAGNTSGDSGDVTFTVDLTAPSVQITAPATGSTINDRTPDITFTATDTNLTAIECSVDSGSFVACTSPWTTPSLSDGSHTITVRGTDAAGNSATSSITLTVDATAPTSTIGTKPPALDTDTTPTFTFTSEPGATFECRIDSDSFAPCTSPFTCGPLGDGPHTFEVRATDVNGNTESPATSYSWTIDSTPPAAPVVSTPADGATTTDDTPLLSGTAEPGSTVRIIVDGNSIGTVTANGSGNWSVNSAHLADGSHTVTARATDAAGNVSTDAVTHTFTADTTPPNGTITEQPGTGGGNPSFTLTPDEGDTSISCSLDGAASSPCSSPFVPSGTLAPGTHTLVVTFTDQWGNARQVTYTFTIAGIPDPTACEAKGIAIANLSPKGSKVTVSGYARLTYVGKTVTIKYKPTKKAVATAVVGSDGKYSASFKAPAKKLWTSNKTVYQASVGSESTAWTKLTRRVQTSTATYAGGKLTVKGTMTKPFLKAGIPVEVKARTGCSDPWKVIGNIKAKKNGTFTFTTNYTPDTGVIFVQFKATLASDKGNKFPTKSFVMPVIVK